MQCQRGVELLVELEHQRIVDLQMATQLVFEPYGVIDGFTAQLAEQIQLAEHGFGRLMIMPKPKPSSVRGKQSVFRIIKSPPAGPKHDVRSSNSSIFTTITLTYTAR